MDSDLKFGLRLIEYVGTPRRLVELAVLAEQMGFDSVWFPHDPFMRHTWAMMAAVAEHTSRIQIGTVGTNPYTTDPSEIASYIATLDDLSAGRAILGLGLHTGDMVGWTGHDATNVVERTRQATEMIRALWRGETVERATGEFAWSDQCYLRFEPPRADIPIYISCFGPDYMALSGAIGDGSLPMITPPESAGIMAAPIIDGAKAAGRDPGAVDICGCAWLSLSEDGGGTLDPLRPMAAYFGPYLEDQALETVGLSRAHFADIRQKIDAADYDAAFALVDGDMFRLGLAGAPADIIPRIERTFALGVTHINLGGPLGPDPAGAIRLMGSEVIPHFR